MGNVWNKDFANDIIVVMQPDGTRRCSLVNVRFRHEKDVPNRDKRIVTVSINGVILNQKFSLNELNQGGSGFASSCLGKVQLPYELNHIIFTIILRGQAVHVKARIFLWCWCSRIVITDVDGTITRSDKRGRFMCFIGLDWNQNGVCHMFSKIQKNGYKVIYLTGRPRYEAEATHKLLRGMEQVGESLPEGAVLLSPKGWRAAIYREVGMRYVPCLARIHDEDFKTPMLKQIRELFPKSEVPFYAGFGNRSSDERSYRELKIPCNSIFHLSRTKFMGERGIQVKCGPNNTVSAFFLGDYRGLSGFTNKFFPQVPDCAAPHHSQTFASRAKNFFQKSKLWKLLHGFKLVSLWNISVTFFSQENKSV